MNEIADLFAVCLFTLILLALLVAMSCAAILLAKEVIQEVFRK